MLLDLHDLRWAEDLLDLFRVPQSVMPRLCPSSGFVAPTEAAWLGAPVPIAGVAGDQQAALFGQAAVGRGDCKNTYGTGCFLLMNVGSRPTRPGKGLLATVAWSLGRETTSGGRKAPLSQDGAPKNPGPYAVTYALEGPVFMAGGAVHWVRDSLRIVDSSADVGPLAAQAADNGGVYFVPALTGLGAPYWDPYARGLLIGLTRGTKPEHLARATEEAICFQTRAVLEAMRETSGVEVAGLRVDGGAARDDFLLQLQSDILGIPVMRPRILETTALGAAALAGLAVGFWSEREVMELAGTDRVFRPGMAAGRRDRLYRDWQRAVKRASGWAQTEPADSVP
jgi:glycerol kinase